MNITSEELKNRIDQADNTLRECLEMMIDFKHGNNVDRVVKDFQYTLADCLYNLMSLYQQLAAEKRQLIDKKQEYQLDEFKSLMKKNAKFSKVIKSAIEIGKDLGDAFAWFFYRNDVEELKKHTDHQSNGLYVHGVGGKGEVEFIKNTQILNGCYVIYHGITNMLRSGDFSLYSGNSRIAGIGELKTTQTKEALKVTVTLTSKIPIEKISQKNESDFKKEIKEISKEFPKIIKQIENIDNTLYPKKADSKVDIESKYDYGIINLLSPECRIALNSDQSLLLLGTWSQYDTLYDILYEEEKCNELPTDIMAYVKCLIVEGSDYNSFYIGEIDSRERMMSIPLLWWNIDDDIIRNIYFKKLNITTVFNPAKLITLFKHDGFEVALNGKLETAKISKTLDKGILETHNFQSICYLITNCLMQTKDAYQSTKCVIDAAESGGFPENTKVEIELMQRNFMKEE